MSGLNAQFGVAKETTYGTLVAPTKFYELIKEDLFGKYERIDSAGIRKGQKVLRSDRFVPNAKGAEGSVEMEVLSRGFGFFLEHMLGAVATTGASAPYTHTATFGELTGKSFTAQVGRPQVGTTTPTAATYEGCKIKSWELSCDVDGILVAKFDLDAETENTSQALATASFGTSGELLSFVNSSVSLGGTTLNVKSVTIKGDNALKTDRYYLGSGTTKKEPLENDWRKYSVEFTADWNSDADTAAVARFRNSAAASTIGAFSAVWTAPTAGRSLTVSATNVRVDDATVSVEGPDLLEVRVSATVTDSGSGSPLSIAYATDDATP